MSTKRLQTGLKEFVRYSDKAALDPYDAKTAELAKELADRISRFSSKVLKESRIEAADTVVNWTMGPGGGSCPCCGK